MTRCKDCIAEGVTTNRKAPHPGPRCASHHRARKSDTRVAAWERRLINTYGITAEEYWRIYEFQGGCCYICRRAKGAGRKRLCVDHCHETGVVRGLLCNPCNKSVLGHLRDEPEAFCRGFYYLIHPPAVNAIGERFVPES